ncbi:hypothetical protein [Pseudomonas sp. TCU-HL1]|uniref:hypothetical protein n=1 Tax=Pseudomonas sp. TCU-HL1 TaxID=1856685 RepID=UPI000857888F|nr:hypothetical protein [Pseudomonas sp. TCU-HL1]AOE85972.1 hypothetical protein THL1_3424 [Pseudomonas sp. TCU-HL1]
MPQRDFPGYVVLSEARLNGDHALAFVAVQPRTTDAEPLFHLVYGGMQFTRLSDAIQAAEDALSRLLHIDEFGQPVFSSPDC